MPVYSKIKSNTGTRGLAEVRVLKNSLRVIFEDGDQYEVSNEGWEYPTGTYSITLSKGNDKVLYVNPPPGVSLLVKFKEFGNRTNGVPEPKIKRGGTFPGKNGGSFHVPDHMVFTSQLEIVEPDSIYKGLTVPYQLDYAFERYQATTNTMIVATQSRLVKIEDFLRIAGFDPLENDIPWSDNILVFLEEQFQKAGKVFQVKLNEKGFISQLVEIPEYLLPNLDNGSKPKKARKTKAKAK